MQPLRRARGFFTKETLRLGQERKATEAEAIDKLVAARNDLDSAAQVTDELTNTYDEAQFHLFSILNKKSQNASTANLINHATLGERMSRNHFLRTKIG